MRRSINTQIAVVAASLLIASAIGAAGANAGTYNVNACTGMNTTAINNSWTSDVSNASAMLYGQYCDTTGPYTPPGEISYDDTLVMRSALGALPVPTSGYLRFDAPLSTTISAVSGTRLLRIYGDDFWRATFTTDSGELEGCQTTPAVIQCTLSGAFNFTGLNTSWLRFGAYCWSFCDGGGTSATAHALLYSATVTITDNTPPVANTPTGDLIGTVTGTKDVTISGSDSTGIKRVDLLIDGNQWYTQSQVCDYTYPAPCAVSSTSWSHTFSTNVTSLANGAHTVAARVYDTAGNTATTSTSFTVDNPPAPTPPTGSTGGSGGTGTTGTTPPPTPPPAAVDPGLRLVSSTLRKKRLRVVSTTNAAAVGHVDVIVRYRDSKRKLRTRTFRSVRSGARFTTSRALSASRASITVRFTPGAGWLSSSIVRTLKARR